MDLEEVLRKRFYREQLEESADAAHFRFSTKQSYQLHMLDYRDLSIEQNAGFKQLYSIMLRYSCTNVISSPGFKRCLPKRKYYLSHNFDAKAIRKLLESEKESAFNVIGGIDVLTIGTIRDYSSNIEVVKV